MPDSLATHIVWQIALESSQSCERRKCRGKTHIDNVLPDEVAGTGDESLTGRFGDFQSANVRFSDYDISK